MKAFIFGAISIVVFAVVLLASYFAACLGYRVYHEQGEDPQKEQGTKVTIAVAAFCFTLWLSCNIADWFLDIIKPNSVRQSESEAAIIDNGKSRDDSIERMNRAIKSGNVDSAIDWNKRAREYDKQADDAMERRNKMQEAR